MISFDFWVILGGGFEFEGYHIQPLAFNPNHFSDSGTPTTRLTIGGVPLSVAHSEINKALAQILS